MIKDKGIGKPIECESTQWRKPSIRMSNFVTVVSKLELMARWDMQNGYEFIGV